MNRRPSPRSALRRSALALAPLLLVACKSAEVKLRYQLEGTLNPSSADSSVDRALDLRTLLLSEASLDWFQRGAWSDLAAPGLSEDPQGHHEVIAKDHRIDGRRGRETARGDLPSLAAGKKGEDSDVLAVIANFSIKNSDGDWKQYIRLSDLGNQVLRIRGSTISFGPATESKAKP
ncbi:MAG: hypothetical protein AB7O97_05125 [Planctomycetota bacterium]